MRSCSFKRAAGGEYGFRSVLDARTVRPGFQLFPVWTQKVGENLSALTGLLAHYCVGSEEPRRSGELPEADQLTYG